jgi:hypothetical protein
MDITHTLSESASGVISGDGEQEPQNTTDTADELESHFAHSLSPFRTPNQHDLYASFFCLTDATRVPPDMITKCLASRGSVSEGKSLEP